MAGDLASRQDYARFLRIQLAARAPIEAWLASDPPADRSPPAMAPLLIEDLAALHEPFSIAPVPFAMPKGADPLGAAWALAGSHLGNRAMLASLGGAAHDLPIAFLRDTTMRDYWRGLLPLLEMPCSEEGAAPAIIAAEAVFGHFLSAVSADRQRLAA